MDQSALRLVADWSGLLVATPADLSAVDQSPLADWSGLLVVTPADLSAVDQSPLRQGLQIGLVYLW